MVSGIGLLGRFGAGGDNPAAIGALTPLNPNFMGNLGSVQAQVQALLAAQAAAAAAGTPADIGSVIAASPGAYGVFIPTLLSRFGPAFTQNLVGIIGGGAVAPSTPGGWGGPGGVNPGITPASPTPASPGGGNPGMNPRNFPPYAPPNPMNAAVPSVPAAGQIPGVPAGWTPWGAAGMTFPQYYAQMHEGVQGALGAVAPSADAAARQARLRAILGMGSAAAGVTARLRG